MSNRSDLQSSSSNLPTNINIDLGRDNQPEVTNNVNQDINPILMNDGAESSDQNSVKRIMKQAENLKEQL